MDFTWKYIIGQTAFILLIDAFLLVIGIIRGVGVKLTISSHLLGYVKNNTWQGRALLLAAGALVGHLFL